MTAFDRTPRPRPRAGGATTRIVVVVAALAIALATSVATTIGPAGAGGASWKLEHDGYRPGELVDARSGVAWAHNPMLGQPEEAPYHAYLVPLMPPGEDGGSPTTLADRVARGTYVGDVQIVFEAIPMNPAGTGIRFGPNGAILRFVLPDLPPGRYSILHCGTPCRTYLGDLMGGTLTVLNPDRSYPPDPYAATTIPAPPAIPVDAPPSTVPVAPTRPSTTVPSTSVAPTSTGTSATDPDGHDDRAQPISTATPTSGEPPTGPGMALALLGVAFAAAALSATWWAARRRRRPDDPAGDRAGLDPTPA